MKKNILLLFTDQQRFDTISALGNNEIKTPNLDKLAGMGTCFTRAYTNCPVCVAARYTMHTGLMPHHSGCYDNGSSVHNTSFMEVLLKNGYQTHGVGKMHFTLKDQLWGYEARDTSEECGAKDDYKHFIDENGFLHISEPLGFRSEMYYIPQVSQMSMKTHNSYWVADRSIDFLKKRDTNRPFFLMTSFIKPHPPFETPAPWNKLYRTVDMSLAKCPDGNDDVITYWNKFQNRYKYRDKGTDINLYRTMKAAYYAAISFVDYNIGRLLSYMNEEGLLDDTYIIFTSDHGEMLGDYNCYGKRTFLDSAARIPMLVIDPSGKMNKGICDTPVSLADIFDTIMDMAEISDSGVQTDGDSLFKVINGEVKRDGIIGQFSYGDTALYMYTTDKYKYIYSVPDEKDYLFNLALDQKETKNLAPDEKYSDIISDYRGRIIEEYKKSGVTEFIDGNKFKTFGKKTISAEPDALLLRQDTAESIPDMKDFIVF